MKKTLLWLMVLVVLAFLVGVAIVVQPFGALSVRSTMPVLAPAEQKSADVKVQRKVFLYFGIPDSPLLAQETRNIDACIGDQECITGLMQALIAGPQSEGEYLPVLPKEALLLGVQVVDDTARLNFNRAFISHHPGGSSSELLTVHALVNTLAANMPHIRQLVLSVAGKPIKTLRGHVDLSRPVPADFSLVRQETISQ